jgi:hypothetical protein
VISIKSCYMTLSRCGNSVGFSLMHDAESPRTAFELLLIGSEKPPVLFLTDNGCNVYNFAWAREPAHFASMRVVIDEVHYRGHTNCSPNYDSGDVSALSKQQVPH